MGNYDLDDEGVPGRRVSLIDNGVLMNFVLGRKPVRDFPSSNGHGRARIPSNSPGPSLSNLIVRSSQAVSVEELKKKFLDICRQRDLPYCYRVETFGPKLVPRLLYKVWSKDGHEELVRGAVLGDLDLRSLRSDLVAAGDDVYVDNMLLNVPHSIVAPSVLFDGEAGQPEQRKIAGVSATARALMCDVVKEALPNFYEGSSVGAAQV